MEDMDQKVIRLHTEHQIHPAVVSAGIEASRILQNDRSAESGCFMDEAATFQSCQAMFGKLAKKHAREDFGIIAGELLTIRAMFPLSLIMLMSNDLNEGINKLIRYQSFVSESLNLEFTNKRKQTRLKIRFDHHTPNTQNQRYLADTILSWVVTLIREFGPLNHLIQSIEIPFDDVKPCQYYKSVFGAPILFSSQEYAIQIDFSAQSTAPYCMSNTKVEAILNNSMDTLLESNLTERVLDLIIGHFPQTPTQTQIADKLGISVRTLQRKLDTLNTSYRELLEQARKQVAHECLQMNISVFETAKKLGFRNASNFSRAFKTWHGIAPSDYQKVHSAHRA